MYPEWVAKVELLGEPGSYSLHALQHLLTLEINDAAAAVWQMCSREYSVEEIVDIFADGYQRQPAEMSEGVLQILNDFADHKLITLWHDRYHAEALANTAVEFHDISRPLLDALENYRHAVEDFFPQVPESPQTRFYDKKSLEMAKIMGAACPQEKINDGMILKEQELVREHLAAINTELDQLFPSPGAPRKNSGEVLYSGNSGICWHTNEGTPGRRIYCNWSEKDNENAFIYQDPVSGEIITLHEPAGWSLKFFYIAAPPVRLWHCVRAGGKRIALGFVDKQYEKIDRLGTV